MFGIFHKIYQHYNLSVYTVMYQMVWLIFVPCKSKCKKLCMFNFPKNLLKKYKNSTVKWYRAFQNIIYVNWYVSAVIYMCMYMYYGKTNNIPTFIFTSTSNNFHYSIHEYSLKGKKESVRQWQNCILGERDRNVFFLF